MNHILLRSLLIGFYCATPALSFAGDLDIIAPPILQIDIPDMQEGWGFLIEGSAVRGYNNNLSYVIQEPPINTNTDPFGNNFNSALFPILYVNPDYAFDLRIAVDYTLPDTANVLKLSYEHVFDEESTAQNNSGLASYAHANIREKLDTISLISEQHILVGPYMEGVITGGIRYAHLGQEFNTGSLASTINVSIQNQAYDMRFNGTGPQVGISTLFHFYENFVLGVDAQTALLVGKNTLSQSLFGTIFDIFGYAITETTVSSDIDNVYSIVPELAYKIYANYFYRFYNGSELQIEAGWKADQFFNVRTFDTTESFQSLTNPIGASISGSTASIATGSTNSDKIGFAGPYLSLHYKL